MMRAAQEYRSAGISVIPIGADKKPCFALLPRDETGEPTWKPLQQAPASDQQLEQWFGGSTPANIGMLTGGASSNLLALDFDVKEYFGEFRDALKLAYPELYDKLYYAVQVQTRKGIHLLIRCSRPVP